MITEQVLCKDGDYGSFLPNSQVMSKIYTSKAKKTRSFSESQRIFDQVPEPDSIAQMPFSPVAMMRYDQVQGTNKVKVERLSEAIKTTSSNRFVPTQNSMRDGCDSLN